MIFDPLTESEGGHVNRFDEVAEESALHSHQVPATQLVAAGHRAQALATQNPVPTLPREPVLDRNRAFACK